MESIKKRILYCIHVNWGWIKQRPHFIAECLNNYYRVDVFCSRIWDGSSKKNKTNVRLIILFRFPLERFKIINKINKYIKRWYLHHIVKRYNILWFTAPTEDSNYILEKIDSNIKVVYDCMDDILEFPNNKDKYDTVFLMEKELYQRADVVICSSSYLKDKISKRYGQRKIVVVNNALTLGNSEVDKVEDWPIVKAFMNSSKIKIVYIGTISEWFDMDLCRTIVSDFHNVEVYLWGPCESSFIQNYDIDGLKFCGAVDHKHVESIMHFSDILIMPFITNELIQSVNPVKLYEYVRSGKPCLAPLYGESKQFDDFVYLYRDHNDCINIIDQIVSGKLSAKKTQEECMRFAEQNTWEKRSVIIKKELDELFE